MTIETRALRDRDDALRLQDLVYSAYGLTYHRSFLYEPDHLLELNRAGQIRSVIALVDGEVVGHMATIRPWFELLPPERAAEPATAVEIGLSIVHPDHRGRRLQTAIGLACLMEERAANPELRTMFAKCLTSHTRSQRSARGMLGRSCALLLGSVPAWVVHDRTRRPSPMTTIVVQSPCSDAPRDLPVPAEHEALMRTLLDGSPLVRRLQLVPRGAAALSGTTSLTRWFEPARRRGVVHVWDAGADLIDRVLESVAWFSGGHMEHVTVLIPLGDPAVAAALPVLEEAGLFFGGFLPDLEDRDVAVLEWLDTELIDIGAIEVEGDESAVLRDAVVTGWQRTREGVVRAG